MHPLPSPHPRGRLASALPSGDLEMVLAGREARLGPAWEPALPSWADRSWSSQEPVSAWGLAQPTPIRQQETTGLSNHVYAHSELFPPTHPL